MPPSLDTIEPQHGVLNVPRENLTKADLAWFDLNKYSPDKLRALGLAEWAQLLNDRAVASCMVSFDPSIANKYFDRIKIDPLASAGSQPPGWWWWTTEPPETMTVYFAPARHITSCAEIIEKLEIRQSEAFDIAWRKREKRSWMPWATIKVDLRAQRTQIKKNFNEWLDSIDRLQAPPIKRDYTNGRVFARWIEYSYLPYFDLKLFADLTGKPIPPSLMVELLGLADKEMNDADLTDLLKAPRRSLKTFTEETIWAICHQRDELALATRRKEQQATASRVVDQAAKEAKEAKEAKPRRTTAVKTKK